MQCPTCGYQLSDLDAECPRCAAQAQRRKRPRVRRPGRVKWVTIGLLLYGLVCLAAGFWLRDQAERLLPGVFGREELTAPAAEDPDGIAPAADTRSPTLPGSRPGTSSRPRRPSS